MQHKTDPTLVTAGRVSGRIIHCLSCKTPVDASGKAPGAFIICPSCGSQIRVPDDTAPGSISTDTAPTLPPASAEGGSTPAETGLQTAVTHGELTSRAHAGGRVRSLGNYEIRGFLGKGGMGCVYKGFDKALHRMVAIKELSPRLAAESELVERFLREARLVARLNHDNICDIYYMGVDNETNTPFFAMELVDGKNLDEILKAGGPLDLESALSIIRQTSLALRAANAKGSMIHRDIKPANIMLTEDGKVKVTDFGLAKAVEGGPAITRTNVIMGTPHYMSPEAARGEACDLRSDIYSLGATFFHILSGRLPFDGPSALSILHKHISERPPDISSLRPDIPLSTSRLIAKMMHKDPAKRHQNYDDLIEDLDGLAAVAADPIAVSPATADGSGSSKPMRAADRRRAHARRSLHDRHGGGEHTPGDSRGASSDRHNEKMNAGGEARTSSRISLASLSSAGISMARTLAPRISIRRRYKLKLILSALLALGLWMFFMGRAGMVYVPGGIYRVGAPDELKQVTLAPFYIQKYEVTNRAYNEALGLPAPARDNADLPRAVNNPAEVAAYLHATGLSLPTDEQWQAAARGPSGQAFPWGDERPSGSFEGLVNTKESGRSGPAPVGSNSLDVSPFSCYDMAGNVSECLRGSMSKLSGKRIVDGIAGSNYSDELDDDSCAVSRGMISFFSYGPTTGFRCVMEESSFTRLTEYAKVIFTIFLVVLLCLFL